jgi:hypothetical protein
LADARSNCYRWFYSFSVFILNVAGGRRKFFAMTAEYLHPRDSESYEFLLLALKSQEARITELERPAPKSKLKWITDGASFSALFLGLVLTFGSLRDVFFIKPEVDRISRISEFSQAVNLAAKAREDLIQAQMQSTDPQLQLAMSSLATPQILNDIGTAREMLRDIENKDVQIPQLIVLISESFTSGDLDAAKTFIDRAVSKTDATPYLRSEARRYEARYFYLTGKFGDGKAAFEKSLANFEAVPGSESAQAYVLGDFVVFEYGYGDCANAMVVLKRFAEAVRLPQVVPQNRNQMISTVKSQITQLQNQHCLAPRNIDEILGS